MDYGKGEFVTLLINKFYAKKSFKKIHPLAIYVFGTMVYFRILVTMRLVSKYRFAFSPIFVHTSSRGALQKLMKTFQGYS